MSPTSCQTALPRSRRARILPGAPEARALFAAAHRTAVVVLTAGSVTAQTRTEPVSGNRSPSSQERQRVDAKHQRACRPDPAQCRLFGRVPRNTSARRCAGSRTRRSPRAATATMASRGGCCPADAWMTRSLAQKPTKGGTPAWRTSVAPSCTGQHGIARVQSLVMIQSGPPRSRSGRQQDHAEGAEASSARRPACRTAPRCSLCGAGHEAEQDEAHVAMAEYASMRIRLVCAMAMRLPAHHRQHCQHDQHLAPVGKRVRREPSGRRRHGQREGREFGMRSQPVWSRRSGAPS